MPIIKNKQSGFVQDMEQERWDKMKDLQVPGQKDGVLFKSLYTIVDPSELTKNSANANVPERLKVHPSGSTKTETKTERGRN